MLDKIYVVCGILLAAVVGVVAYDPSIFGVDAENKIQENKRIEEEVEERLREEAQADAEATERLREEKAEQSRLEERRRLDRELEERRYQR